MVVEREPIKRNSTGVLSSIRMADSAAAAMRPVNRVVGTCLVTLALTTLSACEPEPSVRIPDPPTPAIQIVVTPSNATILIERTQTFVAQVTGGTSTTARTVTWSLSPATGVATITASGNTATARGVGRGTVSVIATHTETTASGAAALVVTVGGAGTSNGQR